MGAIQETTDNIAMLKAAGVPDASISGYGGRLRNNEAQAILSSFRPNITPQTVYSAGNIAQATNAPAPRPNYADPYALRDFFLNTSDMVTAREAVKTANADLLARRQTGRAQQQAIQELPQALNVIRGEQAVAGQQSALSEQAAAESLLAAQSGYDTLAQEANAKYAIAQEERGKLQDLISQTSGKAGISYADSFETALQKAAKYEEKVAKDKKKEAEKDALKALYFELTGKQAKSMSTGELKKKVSKAGASKKQIEDKLNALKVTAAELDIAKARKSLKDDGKSTTAPKNYTDTEQRLLANELFDEAQSKGLYGDYLYQYMQTEGDRLGVDVGEGSIFDNSIRRKFGQGANPVPKAQ